MDSVKFNVVIRPNTKTSALKAYADVTLALATGTLTLKGFSVIQQDNKLPFVGFPSRPGKTPGKYFETVEAEGSLRRALCEEVLSAYVEWVAQQ
jgi:DNA-binding cell septation regulator SpoVG